MEKKFDVIALGELLIDFTENGVSAQGIRFLKQIQAEHLVTYWRC